MKYPTLTLDTESESITSQQMIALEALIDGASITAAAEIAGVSRQTVSKWRNRHPAFIATMNAAARDELRKTQEQLRALAPEAINVLAETMRGGGSASVRAARDLLTAFTAITPQLIGPTTARAVQTDLDRGDHVDFASILMQQEGGWQFEPDDPLPDDDPDDPLAAEAAAIMAKYP